MHVYQLNVSSWLVDADNNQEFVVSHDSTAKPYAAFEVTPKGEPPMTRRFSSLDYALEFLSELS